MHIAQSKAVKYAVAAGMALVFCFAAGKCDDIDLPSLSIKSSAAEVVASGNCGAEGHNMTYVLDSDGVLTIDGEGNMADYGYAPWYGHRSSIKKIVVKGDVNSIGKMLLNIPLWKRLFCLMVYQPLKVTHFIIAQI